MANLSYADFTPEEVAQRAPGTRVIDVREPHEYVGELGHIDGAELVPLVTLAAEAERWERAATLIMVCRSGARSGRATAQLVAMGFQEVHNMVGGMLRWNAEGRATSTDFRS